MKKEKDTKKKNSAPVSAKENEKDARQAKKAGKEKHAPVKAEPKEEKKTEQKPSFFDGPSTRLVHQFVPFVLFGIAILMICFLMLAHILPDGIGVVGNFIRMAFFGTLGWGAFALPLLLINLGVFWRKMVDDGHLRSKVVLSVLSLLSVSTLAHVIVIFSTKVSMGFNVVALWQNGANQIGGGLIGGLIGEVMYWAFSFVGSLIIMIIMTLIFVMFSFGVTPVNIWTYVKYKRKLRKEKRAALIYEAEHKNDEQTYRQRREAEAAERELEDAEREALPEPKRDKRKASKNPLVDDEDDIEGTVIIDESRTLEVTGSIRSGDKNPLVDDEVTDPAIKIPEEESARPQKKDDIYDLNSIFKYYPDGDEGEEKVDFKKPAAPEKPAPAPAPKSAAKNDHSKIIENMKLIGDDDAMVDDDDGEEEPTVGVQLQSYIFPPVELLAEDTSKKNDDYKQELVENAERLMETLRSFNVKIKEITYSRGPTITRYELKPEAGTRVRSIANLVDDIALSLATSGVRIEAPIPNKPAVGIEVPNRTPETVFLRNLIDSDKFRDEQSKLTSCLGADVGGKPIYFNITKMPHLLIAGATGMGKSVCINSIIVSLLYKAKPEEVKLILIDPKKVEFNIYRDIPHLYTPIVSDPKKAAGALASAVAEMERRFELIEEVGVRDIYNYNAITAGDPDKEFMPHMVIIIDELADLMMTAPDDVEASICRLAQKARAAGIHIIIGTQRPSVDVITGLIKANIPSRIACTVASQIDSRTILDTAGAEKLIGRGDMLYAPVGSPKPIRVQGAFVSEREVEAIVEYIKKNNSKVQYNAEFVSRIDEEAAKCGMGKKGASASDGDFDGGDGGDPKLREAIEVALDSGKISTSLLQRRIGVGYGRAAKIIDQMEEMGYVSAPDGNKPRKILITKQEYMEKVINDEIE